MAYQRSTLSDKVKRRLKDGAFSDSDINDYLNDVQNEVLGADEFSFLEGTDPKTLTIGDREVALPATYQTTIRIDITDTSVTSNSRNLIYIPYRQLLAKNPNVLENTTRALPTYFTRFANKVYFDVPVDKAYRITHYFLAKPTQMTADSDVPTIPEEFSEIYVLGALTRAEESRDNYDFGAIHENKMTNLVENLRLRYGARQIGTPGQIFLDNRNASI